jgi:hypothetical protein
MNERIQELAQQAGGDVMMIDHGEGQGDVYGGVYFDPESLKIFSELIVGECLRECWYDFTPKQIADRIRQKFGIEE